MTIRPLIISYINLIISIFSLIRVYFFGKTFVTLHRQTRNDDRKFRLSDFRYIGLIDYED